MKGRCNLEKKAKRQRKKKANKETSMEVEVEFRTATEEQADQFWRLIDKLLEEGTQGEMK